jgi:EAL domain-containing protein (putative c-di-GMP-specific phosphodiesterase class I)
MSTQQTHFDAPAAAPTERWSRAREGVPKVGKVLIVEDDVALRAAYARHLGNLGWEVATAKDGLAASALVQPDAFDVIVSDLSMPRMGGIEFIRAVRQKDQDIPVIFITGEPELTTAVAAVTYGAYRYLTKPFALKDFSEIVARAAHLHQMARLKKQALALTHAGDSLPGDRTTLDTRFTHALRRMWLAYQPIVSWSARAVVAYEALVRSGEASLANPADLIAAAETLGRLPELGRHVRSSVAAAASASPADALLFVNLHPLDLYDDELVNPASPLSRIASRVVLEVTERCSLDGVDGLAGKLRQLRQLGFRLAVDDLGAGYAGLSSFSTLEPEFVKLDMSLIRSVDSSPKKRSIVSAMIRLCIHELGMKVICEGIETAAERDVLAAEGGDLLQGYLFSHPQVGFQAPRWS